MQILGVHPQSMNQVVMVSPGEMKAMHEALGALCPPAPGDDSAVDWRPLFGLLQAIARGEALVIERSVTIRLDNQQTYPIYQEE